MWVIRLRAAERVVRGVAVLATGMLLVAAPRRGAAAACVGDCNGDGTVVIAELITMVNVALDLQAVAVCPAGDANHDGAITVGEIIVGVAAALDGCAAVPPSACTGQTYTYAFTNSCSQAIFIGQNGPGSASTPPSFPESGNWAVAPACTVSDQASVCTGAGSTCQVAAGAALGQCTCTADCDCPGSAPCVSGLCSTTTTFCMPQAWSSGVFWPRTGCTLAGQSPTQTLTCAAGQCGGVPGVSGGQVDCGAGASQVGPNSPVILFEATTSTGSVNYDVSLNSGYNVQLSAAPVGGGYVFPLTTQAATCPAVGCVADLNATCPPTLQNAAGCLDPCTQCTITGPSGSAPDAQIYAALMCDQTIGTDFSGNTPVNTAACSGSVTGGLPTYQDMYCASNLEGDGNSQASTNQGTPTAFAQADCFPGTTFVVPTFTAGYCPPMGQGVCLYDSSTPNVNDFGWADAVNGLQMCSDANAGSACGGYRTTQTGGGYYSNAVGYTCQTAMVTFPDQMQTVHLCLPATTSGLGTCTNDSNSLAPPLYGGVGGTFNAAWLTAGLQAAASTSPPYTAGTTPYYETFKAACPSAYAWQYDDAASGFSCTVSDTVPPAGVLSGFAVSFCPPSTPGGLPTSTPTPTTAGATSTPTCPMLPTPSATALPTGVATATTTTATTATATATATAIATATATATVATPTTTPGGATLTWIANAMSTTTVTVPVAGMSYASMALILNDSAMRFCTASGMQPIVSVDFGPGNQPIIGAPPLSTSQLNVANIPAAPLAGTYDVLIQTDPACGAATMLTMPGAITYQ